MKLQQVTEKDKKMLKVRQLEQQMHIFQRDITNGKNALREIATTIGTLENLKKEKGEQNSLVPLGSGVFTNAKISNLNKLLIEIGSGVIVEKTVDETIEIITIRRDKITLNLNKMSRDVSILSKEYNELAMTLYQKQAKK